MTFKILMDDTRKVICRSNIHPASNNTDPLGMTN
jgi:hypothetical protein